MARDITILIADDHPVYRKGLRQIIESDPGMKVISEVSDGEAALSEIEFRKPDLAILDIDMPKINGLEVLKTLVQKKVIVDVIFLTMYDEEQMFNKAIELGAMGYVLKESAVNDIVESIKTVASGKHYISPSISGYLLKHRNTVEPRGTMISLLSGLTASERKILKMVASNKTSQQIADELFITVKTVEHHRSNICKKLSIQGSNALLRFALDNKSRL